MATSKKITETGPIGLRGIRNTDLYGHLSSLASSGDTDAIGLLNALSSRKSRPFGPNDDVGGYFEPQALPQGTPYASLGNSKYDEPYIIGSDPEQVNEIRYENQPWYDTLANGVGKMLGTAGTTFISSLVGLPYGIGAAINQGRWSAIWDNSVTKGLADVDSWLEKNMTNYKSKEQKENPWYDPSNLFSMNFIADDVIKNAGFTVGAAASMAVGSGALGLLSRSLGFVNKVGGTTKMAANTLGALFSATGEGMIEARHGVDNRNKIEKQRLRDALTPEYNALQAEEELITREFEANRGKSLVQTGDGRLSDPAYDTYKQKMEDLAQRKNELDQRMQAGIQQIEESGLQMGNKILLANQGLLTINNMLQFSKAMTKSFDKARHMAESTSKYAKPFGVSAARTAEGTYKISGKNFGRVVAAVKNPVTEGSEEMNQQWIQSSAEAAYNEKDANDYWKAKLDKDSYRETSKGLYTMGNILDKGFQDSWGDAAQWEQFVVGAITGLAGSYSPTKIFNQDKKYGVLDPRRYGSWEGGSPKAIRDFDKEYNTFEENIDDVNKILQQEDFPSRVKNLVAHTYLEGQKENAANNNDIKAWKDADDKQTIHDIQAFIRAGKLDDLKAIYEEMGADLSDEDIENIVKSTTREISAEEDKANFDQKIDEQIAAKQREIDALYDEQIALERSLNASTEDSREANQEYVNKQGAIIEEKITKGEKEIADLNQQKEKYVGQKKFIGSFVDDKGNRTHTNDDIRQEIKHNTSELNRKLNSYLDSIAIVNDMTNGNLSKDQEDNLAYLHNLSKEKIVRFNKIMAKVRKQLPNNFLLKTSKTPEQLSKEFASSDLAFKQDETTPKGYVEVDTSLMNDKNFGVFFMDTIMRGNNIEAEPAEEDNKKEEKDEKKKTAEQEKREKQVKKDKEEQKSINVTNYKKHFYDSMRQNTNMTLDETRQAFEALEKDIDDASVLKDESQEFFNTYLEYMLSPQKVDQDQEKETQKVVDEQQKENVKDSSIRELAQRTDLKELLAKAKEDSDIPLINKIKKAMLLRQQRAKTQSAARDTSVLASYNPADKEAAIQAQMRKLEKQLDVSEDSDRELTMQELADRLKGYDVQDVKDAIQEGLNPVDLATLKQLEQADPDAFDKRMEEMTNTVQQALDDLEKHLSTNLPDIDDSKVVASKEDVQAYTDQLKKEVSEGPAVPKKQDEVNPVISVPVFDTEAPTKQDNIETVSDATVLDEDKRQGVSGVELQRSGQHPWRAVTRRVGYKSNVPYSEYLEGLINTVQDPEEAHRLQKQLRRVITLEKILEKEGAFSRVEQGKVSKNNVIKFAVSKAVNEEAGDFVIFMTDEQGNILADLPSSDPEIEPNTNEIAGLADLYAEARKQWEELTEEEKDKTEFVPLKGLSTKVDYTYFGKVRYQDQRQSLNELFGSEKFTLAIKVSNNDSSSPVAFLDTGKKNLQGKTQRDKIREPLTGTKGQPYVLIPTSKANKDNARGEGYLAVPILTPTFGEISNDSKFYQVVKDLLERIKSGKVQTKQAKELLSNLFGVSNVHVNFDGDITKKGSGITITTFARTNQSEKGNSHTVFKGSKEEMDIDAVLESLGRFYINISNKKINTAEPFYTLSNGEKVYYNNMIGEIATTNAAMPHTVNDFFTVVPLEKKDGKFQQVAKKPARMKFPVGNMNSVFDVKVSYKDGTQKIWSIHPSEGFECRDEQGRPIYEEDKIHTASEKKLAAQYKAEAFGRFYMKDFSQPFVVMIDDKAYLYNPADRTFKSAKEVESTYPRYNKSLSEYDALQDMLTSMEAARLEAEEAGVIKKKTLDDKTKEENIKRVEATIAKIQSDGTKYVLCDVNGKEDPNGDYYKDENDLLHARVTSMAEGDPQVEPFKETLDNGEENTWIVPSTTIGNQVDEFIRVFFEGGDPMSTNTPALSESSKKKLLEDLKKIQESLKGWKVASRNIVASGVIGVTDANGDQLIARVAGTLDLLLYNPEKDEYAIYDIKTHRSTIDFDNVDKDSHISKWSAQLSLYKELLEAKYPEMKGKIVGLKIIPIKVSQDSYDASEHTYTEKDNHLYDENEKEVKAVFNYDGQTIPISERALKINMGKKGFKASYNSKEGRNQIIISKPRPLPGEAPKQKVKEGILKVINKISDKRPVSDYLKQSHKGLPEAVALCATIDEARKNGTLADLMLTEATMNMLSDMLNESLIDKHAALDKLNLSGITLPKNIDEGGSTRVPNAPKGVPVDDSLSPETLKEKATERGIVDKTTEKAWERLSEENKQKVANTANHIQVKKALQDAQKNPRKDPNKLVGEYLHRKAVETSGYKKLNMQKELEWLNKVLPQLSRLNKVRIVEGLIRCSDGTWDYGQLRNGLLYIGTNGKEGTVYHEAFHAVTQWLLTDTELDALYEAARERYGNLDVVSLEERLADDFMAYTMGVKPSYKPRHRNIFQKLWDAIKKMLGHTSMIDKLYQNINDGVYAGAVLRFGDNEFADITSEDREVSMRYNFLDKEQVARLNEGQVTKEQYEVLDSNEKRYLFHCVL